MKDTSRALRNRHIAYHTFWGFDSFHGLPEEHPSERRSAHSDSDWQAGAFNAADALHMHSFAQLERRLVEYVGEPRVRLIRGYFNESCTPALVRQNSLRPALFVDMDVDLYISAKQALEFLLKNKLMVIGTIVGYDDWPAGGRQGGEQRVHREATQSWGLRWRNIVPGCKDNGKMQCVFELIAVGDKFPDCDCQ